MSRKQTTVIYGGGLAGLSLGISLRQRNVPVELHEAGTYPRHRVCGEFIAGAGKPLFEELGIATALEDALSLETTVWHCGRRQVLSKRLPSPVTSISRYTLDDRLSQLFQEKGGVLHCGSRVKEDSVRHEGSVWATGRRPPNQDSSGKGWIGLKCHASGLTLKSDLEFYFGRNGYLGISPISKNRFNICGLFRVNRRLLGTKQNLFNRYLEDNGLRHLVPRMEEAQVDPESWCAVAGLDYRNGPPETAGLRIGDQFGLIAPLTGNGMSIAFESAALAAPFIESWASHKRSWQEAIRAIHDTQTKAFAKRKQFGKLLQVFLLNPCGQSLLRLLCATHILPFKTLYSLTHQV
ncbi:MAG: hypothetical protein O7C75_04505 [Verrucomicrobia bacterium]|nr:hypothetical protein [Verrucomicrobiota bacterium]